ncbi:P-loop NTPase fold protein [Cellulomonas sp. NPDC057328]|uniref:YobI family P-loop NTPase n=1 Tax=Cellulomonas sp. NPDC057328 TaxID=3346101 RepID=UPI00362EB000
MTPAESSLPADVRQVPRLQSLAPKYSDANHGTYVEILNATIQDEPAIRNIALTGAYGTGKSSILRRVIEMNQEAVVEVSLSTLGSEPTTVELGEDSNPAATTKTNRIQKEIVKQLLYQQLPSEAPESRFRRIAHFPRARVMQASLGASLLLMTFLALTGLVNPVLTNLVGVEMGKPPVWLLAVGAYVGATAVIGALIYLARHLMHQRLQVEKVTAGPATISLPPRSASYFDEYLDEIIYFFETNNRRNVVILEDLDRFDDPHIFEALRALNNLLNTAKQLDGRSIRFVYALRDSIFEKLGHNADLAGSDEAKAEIVRSNRTKFFDLVIPVAPFITHKNARDLMIELLEERGFEISRDLVDVAARHTADMRLIHNIINEFAVFKARVLDVPKPAPDLTADRLFAMMLFKNSHLADFEAIRIGESSLDKLYQLWRDLVEGNLERLRVESDTVRALLERNASADEYAAALALKTEAVVRNLSLIGQRHRMHFEPRLRVNSVAVSREDMSKADFWRSLIREGRALSVANVQDYYGNTQPDITISVDDLRAITGDPFDFDAGGKPADQRRRRRLVQIPREMHFLRYCDWQSLALDTRFTYARPGDDSPRAFREWVDAVMRSPLARDLVTQGYITPHFALHAASFYGTMMSKEALTYLMRYVESGKAGAEIPLTGADVEALLKERGNGLIQERSALNISIVDHLLDDQSPHVAEIAARIARWSESEQEFVRLYLRSGRRKSRLVAELTPRCSTIFEFLIADAPSDLSELVDAALVSWLDEDKDAYAPSDHVRAWIEHSYTELDCLRSNTPPEHVEKAVQMIAHQGAVLADVTSLSSEARRVLLTVPAFQITAANLVAVTGTNDLSLDSLRAASPIVAEHMIENLPSYLAAYRDGSDTRWTTSDQDGFLALITDAASRHPRDAAALVTNASRACSIPDLTAAPTALRSVLVTDLRVPPTFANVWAYVGWEGHIDEALAVLLTHSGAITELGDDPGERAQLAVAILHAADVLPDPELRVRLAKSLQPGTITAEELQSDSGGRSALSNPSPNRLIGLLISEGLIDDDEYAFQPALMTDWPTVEFAIGRSKRYREFVGPKTLHPAHVPDLLASPKISSSVKDAVVSRLIDFVNASPATAEPIAQHVVAHRLALDARRISALAGNVADTAVAAMLAESGDVLSDDEVIAILNLLGGDYPDLTYRGRDQPQVENTPGNLAVVERMKQAGFVSSIKVEGKVIRVHKFR